MVKILVIRLLPPNKVIWKHELYFLFLFRNRFDSLDMCTEVRFKIKEKFDFQNSTYQQFLFNISVRCNIYISDPFYAKSKSTSSPSLSFHIHKTPSMRFCSCLSSYTGCMAMGISISSCLWLIQWFISSYRNVVFGNGECHNIWWLKSKFRRAYKLWRVCDCSKVSLNLKAMICINRPPN